MRIYTLIFILTVIHNAVILASKNDDNVKIIIKNKTHVIVKNIPYTLYFSNGSLYNIDFNSSGHCIKVHELNKAFSGYQSYDLFFSGSFKVRTSVLALGVKKLIFTSNQTIGKIKITFCKEYTFYLGSPLVKVHAFFSQNPSTKWDLIRINQFNISKSFFTTWAILGDGIESGSVIFTKGNRVPTAWVKEYKWCALFNAQDTLGLIALNTQKAPFIHFGKRSFYINGFFKSINKEKQVSVENYWFFGASIESTKTVGNAVNQLASGVPPEKILQTEENIGN